MILAFLVVIGFLYWLNITAEPTEIAIVEEDTGRTSTASAILDEADFLADATEYEGQVVEVTGARVASRLGPQAFWIGEDDAPFLVKMAPGLVDDGTEVQLQQRVNLLGTVHMMTDSAHAAWDVLGAFPNEGDKIVAEFAIGSPFLEVTNIEGPGGASEGGAGESGSN
jgi:hypothetical protein